MGETHQEARVPSCISCPQEESGETMSRLSGVEELLADSGSEGEQEASATNTAKITSLQERVNFLENELVSTRMELACSRSNEDHLRMQVSKLSAALAAKDLQPRRISEGEDLDEASSSSDEDLLMDEEYAASHRNLLLNHVIGDTYKVPTANPFLTRRNPDGTKVAPHRARKTSCKALNPGSCSSGLDLLALAHVESSGSLTSAAASAMFGLTRPKKAGVSALNPNSCASGLNLLTMGLEGSSMASASQLLRNQSGLTSEGGPSMGNIAMLLGNARILSGASLSRRGGVGSRTNVRQGSRGLGLHRGGNGGSTKNAEWDLFE